MAKKKSQLKNPQRGFATTSVAKKKDPEPEAKTQDATAVLPAANLKPNSLSDPKSSSQPASTQVETSWDDSQEQRDAEERFQYLEKIRTASEKEASRWQKSIEYEKRMSSSYTEFYWDDPFSLRDQIIDLELKETEDVALVQSRDDKEKQIIHVATISLVLRSLGFSREQISDCLVKVPQLELESALRWIYLRHAPQKAASVTIESYEPYGSGQWAESGLSAAFTSLSAVKTKPQTPLPTDDRAKALIEQESSPQLVRDATGLAEVVDGKREEIASDNAVKSSILDYRDPEGSSSDEASDATAGEKKATRGERFIYADTASESDGEHSSDDDIDPTAQYVAAKLRLTSLQRKLGINGKPGKKGSKTKPKISPSEEEVKEVQDLEARLRDCQRDYLFNSREAEATFAKERAKLDKEELAERLAIKVKERQTISLAGANADEQPTARPATPPGNDAVSDAEDGTLKGTLLGDLMNDPDEASSSTSVLPETNGQGQLIIIRDMGLPKAYTGKTPKSLLDDALRRLDKIAKATYKLISTTRAARAVVTIRWDANRVQQFGMMDEACENKEQAFHYVATLALFAISPDSGSHKFLPGPYRNLWGELESRKKTALSTAYEAEVRTWCDIVMSRETRQVGASGLQLLQDATPLEPMTRQKDARRLETNFADSHVLKEDYEARRSSPSYQNMLSIRQGLPISAYREQIVSTVEQHQVVVLCGETGCGKSTQTPTMILENELMHGRHAKIYCTEPRRISAISLAQRVSQELGEAPGALGGNRSLVGYNIRLESRVSAANRLVYATTGIVLRVLESDTELREVTHVIIDEVHERTIDSDFLLIILKTLLRRRKDLRVILMSATVDAEKLADYMGPGTPILQVPGRTFPVAAYYLEDAVERSDYRLDMDSDTPYVQKIQHHKPDRYDDLPTYDEEEDAGEHSQFRTGYSRQTQMTLQAMNEYMINFDLILSLLETICFSDPDLRAFSTAILVFLPSLEAIRKLCDLLDSHPRFGTRDFVTFPLHSSISNEQQSRVFEVPTRGVRKIVVSTNIAETGVTIPDITAVIDSGKHKEMRFDEKRQIAKLVECWIARSNALQRRGRAGRVQEGICFHLFTKARLENTLAQHPIPEMLRLSLQDLALRIKILKFSGSVEDTLLQALDPPLSLNIQRAVASLIDVKALTANEQITQLGRHLVKLPLDVYTAKFCLMAALFGCLDAALTIAATLNSKTFFLTPFGREMEAETVRRSFRQADEHSDFLVMYRAYCLWRSNCQNGSWSAFTRKHFLSHTILTQIEELKAQYMGHLIEAGFITSANTVIRHPKGPRLRFVQLEEAIDRYSSDAGIVTACIASSMHPKLLYKDVGNVWKTLSNNASASIHPSSSNLVHGRRPDLGNASFVTYFNIQQSKKLYVWENGAVPEKSILLMSGDLETKPYAHSVSVDKKIRRHVECKSALALGILRDRFADIWQARLESPSKPLSQQQNSWFRMLLQALSTAEAEESSQQGQRARPAVSVNVVRPS